MVLDAGVAKRAESLGLDVKERRERGASTP